MTSPNSETEAQQAQRIDPDWQSFCKVRNQKRRLEEQTMISKNLEQLDWETRNENIIANFSDSQALVLWRLACKRYEEQTRTDDLHSRALDIVAKDRGLEDWNIRLRMKFENLLRRRVLTMDDLSKDPDEL